MNISVLEWPSENLDLNPIKILCNKLKGAVQFDRCGAFLQGKITTFGLFPNKTECCITSKMCFKY